MQTGAPSPSCSASRSQMYAAFAPRCGTQTAAQLASSKNALPNASVSTRTCRRVRLRHCTWKSTTCMRSHDCDGRLEGPQQTGAQSCTLHLACALTFFVATGVAALASTVVALAPIAVPLFLPRVILYPMCHVPVVRPCWVPVHQLLACLPSACFTGCLASPGLAVAADDDTCLSCGAGCDGVCAACPSVFEQPPPISTYVDATVARWSQRARNGTCASPE